MYVLYCISLCYLLHDANTCRDFARANYVLLLLLPFRRNVCATLTNVTEALRENNNDASTTTSKFAAFREYLIMQNGALAKFANFVTTQEDG